jgi:hypothetical protein
MIEIKRMTEQGHPLAAADITIHELEYIYHALREVDPDLRSPDLEDKIQFILDANTTS